MGHMKETTLVTKEYEKSFLQKFLLNRNINDKYFVFLMEVCSDFRIAKEFYIKFEKLIFLY